MWGDLDRRLAALGRAVIPLPFTVGLRSYSSSGEDAHGNAIPTFAAAVDTPAFWWTPTSTEPRLAGQDRVIVDMFVVVDSATAVYPHDRIDVEDREFEVIGEPEDYDHGPFGYSPRRRPIALRRVDG